jgi:hypothetical protein
LSDRRSAIDASDTGARNAYVVSFVPKMMGLRLLVTYMKSGVRLEKITLLEVGYDSNEIFVNNYEQLAQENCFKYHHLWNFKGMAKNIMVVDDVHRSRNPKTTNLAMPSKRKKSDAYLPTVSAMAFEILDKAETLASALGL